MKRFTVLVPILVTLASFGCQNALVREYQPANTEEQAIKELIMQREDAHHRGDKSFFERKMLDDGQFIVCPEGQCRECTKAEWLADWEHIDKECRDVVEKDLKILELSGDTAILTVRSETPRWWIENKHTLRKINGEWYFAKQEHRRRSW
jgi:hypothetical protein